MKRNVFLYGVLADKYGSEPITVSVDNTSSLIFALQSKLGGFRTMLREYPDYFILLSDDDKENAPGKTSVGPTEFEYATEIHVLPNHEGSGIEVAVAVFGMTAGSIGAIVVNMAASMLLSMALGAIAQSLAPSKSTMAGSTGQERPEETPSTLYNGPQNVSEQGFPVPVIYGIHMTGSIVISAGTYTEQLLTTPAQAAPPANGGGTAQPASPAAVSWQWGGGI